MQPDQFQKTSISLLPFGMIRDVLGYDILTMDYIADTDSLHTHLLTVYPALNGLSFTIAVNKQIIATNTSIPVGAEIALLPPFSGG